MVIVFVNLQQQVYINNEVIRSDEPSSFFTSICEDFQQLVILKNRKKNIIKNLKYMQHEHVTFSVRKLQISKTRINFKRRNKSCEFLIMLVECWCMDDNKSNNQSIKEIT